MFNVIVQYGPPLVRDSVCWSADAARAPRTYLGVPSLGTLVAGKDYLMQPYAEDSEAEAHRCAGRILRAITFMDALDLRIARYVVPNVDQACAKRDRLLTVRSRHYRFTDHTRTWKTSKGLRVITTEPYGPRNAWEEGLAEWCDLAKWRAAIAAPGAGIHAPPDSTLIILAPIGGADVQILAEKADELI